MKNILYEFKKNNCLLTVRAVLNEHGDGIPALAQDPRSLLVGRIAHVDPAHLQQLIPDLKNISNVRDRRVGRIGALRTR